MSIESEIWGANDPRKMPAHFFGGAIWMDYDSAKRAVVEDQNYTVCPRYWYLDAVFVRVECKEKFLFGSDEQRFWYEDRKFFVDSRPTRCVKCRKVERRILELRQEYDGTVSEAMSGGDMELKRRVASIVDELEDAEGSIPEKLKTNRAVLRAQLAKSVD